MSIYYGQNSAEPVVSNRPTAPARLTRPSLSRARDGDWVVAPPSASRDRFHLLLSPRLCLKYEPLSSIQSYATRFDLLSMDSPLSLGYLGGLPDYSYGVYDIAAMPWPSAGRSAHKGVLPVLTLCRYAIHGSTVCRDWDPRWSYNVQGKFYASPCPFLLLFLYVLIGSNSRVSTGRS
jgi:hypothetical protein